jgi:hypothetical protein
LVVGLVVEDIAQLFLGLLHTVVEEEEDLLQQNQLNLLTKLEIVIEKLIIN